MKFYVKMIVAVIFVTSLNCFADESNKSVNIYTPPVNLLVGELEFGAEFGISPSITIGPSLGLYSRNYNSSRYTGTLIGFHADFYLSHPRFTDSWVIAPFIDLVSLRVTQDPYSAVTLPGTAIGTVIDYRWFWPGGFNLGLGGVIGVYSFSANTTLTDSNGNSTSISSPYNSGFVGIDFRLGYAF
jgi:hypothetical protein